MDNRIKVLHYGLSYNQGGIENLVHSWFLRLPNDIQFDFLNDGNRPIAFEDEYKRKGSKIYYITHRYKNPIKHLKELQNILKNGKYDYIHYHVENIDEADTVIAANSSNTCRNIYHIHSLHRQDTLKEKTLIAISKMLLIGRDYLVLACSSEAGEFNFKKKKFEVIENGIVIDKFQFNDKIRENMREKYNISNDDFVIGHVGRFGADKNYPFIISTFAKFHNNYVKSKLMLIGNMNEFDEIKNMIKQYDIEDCVIMTGKVQDTSEYYSAMDMFYLPSLNEGMSIAMIEAQASGLNCVASDVQPHEINISNKVVFINFNENEAVEEIYKIANKKEDRKLVKINLSYDIQNATNKLFNFYRSNLRNERKY